MTFYQQIIKILKDGRQYGLLSYVPARDRRNLVRLADEVGHLLRCIGGKDNLRMAEEIGRIRDRAIAWAARRRRRRSDAHTIRRQP